MFCQITWRLDPFMSREMTRCRKHHAPNFTDPDRDQCRVGEVTHAERDVDPFINQAHRFIEQSKSRGYCLVSIEVGIEDRPQDQLSAAQRRREREDATQRRLEGLAPVDPFDTAGRTKAGRRPQRST